MIPKNTNVQTSSLEAYFREVLPTLGERQVHVLKVFQDNPTMDFTNMELAEELGWSINRVTPRVYELRGKGKNNKLMWNPVLTFSRRRLCLVTKRPVMAWQFNPNRRMRRSG